MRQAGFFVLFDLRAMCALAAVSLLVLATGGAFGAIVAAPEGENAGTFSIF